jgi:Uma2 family endonuclease
MRIDEFWQQYAGQPYELINGQAVPTVDKGYLHEVVTSRVLMCLSVHVEAHYLGEVLGEGVRFAASEQDLRAIDVAFISNSKLASIQNPESYLPFPPDLVVEVVSSRYTSTEIQNKANLFLEAGAKLVWIIDPQPKEVTVLLPDGSGEILSNGQLLTGHQVIPAFNLSINDLFPPLDTFLKYPDHS